MKRFTALLMSAAIFISTISIPAFNINSKQVFADDPTWPSQPDVVATSACLIEASTGTILYDKKCHKKMYPASITKILTALVTIENSDLSEDVTFSENAVYSLEYGDANMAMEVGEIMSVEDCLYGLMLMSANEVATALAEHVGGSVEGFSKMMNERAKEAGATDSNFVNPNGLHNDNHYITAYDMAMITKAAIKNPVFLSISGTTLYTVGATNKKDALTIPQRHKMLKKTSGYYYEGILGGKTGYTDQSGTTLVSYAKRNGMTLICVVLNSNSVNSYIDTTKLFDYGFDNFNLVNVSDNDNRFKEESDSYRDMLIPEFGDSSSSLLIDTDDCIVLPKDADFTNVSSSINFDISLDSDDTTTSASKVADIQYTYLEHDVGTAAILYSSGDDSKKAVTASSQTSDKKDDSSVEKDTENKKQTSKNGSFLSKSIMKKIAISIVIVFVLFIIIALIRRKQKQLNEIRARKRRRSY